MKAILFVLSSLFSFAAFAAPLQSVELDLGTFACNGSPVSTDVVVPAPVGVKQIRVSAEPTGSGVIRYRFSAAAGTIVANVISFSGPVTDGVLFQPDEFELAGNSVVTGEAACSGSGNVTVRAVVYFVAN